MMENEKYILAGGEVVTPEAVIHGGTVIVEDGRIKNIGDGGAPQMRSDGEIIDCSGRILMPGFVDVHTHGGGGLDFKDEAPEAIAELSGYYYRHGVTSVLATLPPLSHDLLLQAVERIADFLAVDGESSNIIGIHLEGPYINRSMSGGNRKDYIEEPDFDRWKKVFQAGNGFIKLITVAPELKGIDRIIEDAAASGVAVALGHSNADSATAAKAVSLGARQVTHLFNGMPGFHHRKPGLLSQSLLSDSINVQIIADGVHVHPEIVRLAVKIKSPERVLLITDSMRAAGLPDGEYDSAGNTVRVVNGISKLQDGTLAGSTLVFEKGVALVAGLPETDLSPVSRMASLNACRSLGIDKETGSIEPGKSADLVVLNNSFEVELTMRRGKVRYRGTMQ